MHYTHLRNGVFGGPAAASGIAQPSVVTSFPVGDSVQQPYVHVRDVDNDFDLIEINADTLSEAPASTSKLANFVLMWQYHSADWTTGTVTLNATDVTNPMSVPLSTIGLLAGDVLTWEKLAHAILLGSSTEACRAVGRVIGTEIFVAAGSTGNTGETRFIEALNAWRTANGIAGTFDNHYGGSKTFGPDVVRNQFSARGLSKMCEAAMAIPAVAAIAATATYDLVVAGASPRTIALRNQNPHVDGPYFDPSGIAVEGVVGGKIGSWVIGAYKNYNLSQAWTSPAGHRCVITTLGSIGPVGSLWDQEGLIYGLQTLFSYLRGAAPGTDAAYANVKVLIGADVNPAVEESSGRTLTLNKVSVAPPVNISEGGAGFVTDSRFTVPHDAALLPAGSPMTYDVWFKGFGSHPAGEAIWAIKADAASDLSWTWNNFGVWQIFVSVNGTAWTSAVAYNPPTDDRETFFNGAPRHLMLVYYGTAGGDAWRLYLNGNRLAAGHTGVPFAGTAAFRIGGQTGAITARGTHDDMRLTVGTARATAKKVTLYPYKVPRS
ncbi:MAG TPA: hypothetical protein VMZ71_02345 [Gemmataceae bacterium]|nr:hypothetical protein [Gemmataceae bacterium]